MPDKNDNNDNKGVGDSTTRKGENIIKEDGKEAGRRDTGTQGPSKRPTGESTPRDMTGIKPDEDDDAKE